MDLNQSQTVQMIDGHPLRFIRCDSTGRELTPAELSAMSFTNDTINRIVTQASVRFGSNVSPDGSFAEGISTL